MYDINVQPLTPMRPRVNSFTHCQTASVTDVPCPLIHITLSDEGYV